MKLYTRKYVGHKHEPYRYTEVDPADLELAVLGAWEELKKALIYRADGSLEAGFDAGYNQAMKRISDTIADLESAADLKVPEIQEKARAWEILSTDNGSRAESGTFSEYIDLIQEQARRELATDPAKALRQSSGQEKGEEKK